MKKLIMAVVLAALGIGSALAADLPPKSPPPPYRPPPPVVTMFNWTGFYVGIHGGADWFENRWGAPLTANNIAGGCPGCPVPVGVNSGTSWLVGGQIGANYQISSMVVVGIEGEGSWTGLKSQNVSLFIPPSLDKTKTDAIGTVAARLGVAWDRSLWYLKGGGAWAHSKYTTTLVAAPATDAQSASDTRWGWVAGAGVEWAFFDNWSVKVEYEHIDLGKKIETLQPLPACVGCLPFDYQVRSRIEVVKVGLNYRFGGPVSARY